MNKYWVRMKIIGSDGLVFDWIVITVMAPCAALAWSVARVLEPDYTLDKVSRRELFAY